MISLLDSFAAKVAKEGEAEASSSKIEELSGSIITGERYLTDATTISKKDASDFAKILFSNDYKITFTIKIQYS